MRPTTISLQVTDSLVKYPMGVLERVLFKVVDLYVLVDFMIRKIEEDTCSLSIH